LRRGFERRESVTARAQLAQIVEADEVVYNPAGEMVIATPVSRFFELAVVARAGRPFAVVNFTFDPQPLTALLAAEVLPRARVVFARDAASADRIVAAGVDPAVVQVVADAAFLYRPAVSASGGGGVGLATNATLDSAQREGWRRVVELMAKDQDEVTFVSNEHGADVAFARELGTAPSSPLRLGPVAPDFRAYAAQLAPFDLVVTARFHTAVLCCSLGVPCIAVEGTNQRIRPALRGLLPENQLVTTTEPGWPEKIAAAAGSATAPAPAAVEAVRRQILDAYERSFPLGA
jgi:polysaccharide pyruvyl transferase WcaK-like protein